MVNQMTSVNIVRDPGRKWHYEKLDLEPDAVISLGDEGSQTPFQYGEQATVFHVQEVMRLSLQQLRNEVEGSEPDSDGNHLVSTGKIQHTFNEMSYSADIIWSNWGDAVLKAGGTIAGILQRILGVRIRGRGKWIPHYESMLIQCKEWNMIDDLRLSSQILDDYVDDSVWISPSTGLRLVRSESISGKENQIQLGFLLGEDQRFPTPESLISWCLNCGTKGEPPSDQGDTYFFRLPNDVESFQTLPHAGDGPSSDWWTRKLEDPNIPRFFLNDEEYVFGVLYNPPVEGDEYDKYWKRTYPHMINLRTKQTLIIDPIRLGLELGTVVGDDLLEVQTSIWRNLSNHLQTELLRALRIIVARQGHLNMPHSTIEKLGKLGFSSSKIDSPFSDLFFIKRRFGSKPEGLVVGSPIESLVKSTIFRLNWYEG